MQAEKGSVCSLLAPNEKEIEQDELVVQVSPGVLQRRPGIFRCVRLGRFWNPVYGHGRVGAAFLPASFSLPHLCARRRRDRTLSIRKMAVILGGGGKLGWEAV